jgi:hypothetical protein
MRLETITSSAEKSVDVKKKKKKDVQQQLKDLCAFMTIN